MIDEIVDDVSVEEEYGQNEVDNAENTSTDTDMRYQMLKVHACKQVYLQVSWLKGSQS